MTVLVYVFYFYVYGTFFLGSTFPLPPTTAVVVEVLPVFLITDTTGDLGVTVVEPVFCAFGVLVTADPTGFFSAVVGTLDAVRGALVVVPCFVPVVAGLVPIVGFFSGESIWLVVGLVVPVGNLDVLPVGFFFIINSDRINFNYLYSLYYF